MTESIQQFLRQCMPFDQLSDPARQRAEQAMQLVYVNDENLTDVMPMKCPQLYVVKKGHFDLIDPKDRVLERLEPGDVFGFPSLLTHRPIVNRLRVIEDGLILVLDAKGFHELCHECGAFGHYFRQALNERLLLESGQKIDNDWSQRRISDVLSTELVSVASDMPVSDAAMLMTDKKISSLLVVDDGQLAGMLTDRDLRSRVVAQKADLSQPVSTFMSSPVVSVGSHQLLFNAMQAMTTHHVHHLAVVSGVKTVGVITVTDLIRQQSSEPLYLISQIRRAHSVAELATIAKRVPEHLHQFANRIVDVHRVGDLLATFTDAFNQRLIDLYIDAHGQPPCEYVWLCFGSQARHDQSLSSDQDNGLLLDDSATDGDKQWFAEMAEYVCHGLAESGLKLCAGNIMASNPQLRLTLREWCDTFAGWIHSPDKDAVMRTNIFFDRRALCGNQRLFQRLTHEVAELAANNAIYLANLAANTVSVSVPLGLFNRFRTQETAEHRDVIDVKKQGVAIINDVARIHSLANRVSECATPERINLLIEQGAVNEKDGKNWLAAWRFLVQLRLEHQLRFGRKDNLIEPGKLDSLQRRQLKTAFKIIKEAQDGLNLNFSRGAF